MSAAVALSARLLERAARRWPAGSRDDVLREWSAELHVMAHDAESSRWSRGRRALAYSVSLLLSRPDRPGTGLGAALSLRRTAVALATAAYVVMLGVLQWALHTQLDEDWIQPLHFPDRGLALGLGVAALLPVPAAAVAGRALARRIPTPQRLGPFRLAGHLIAVVVVLVGVGWTVNRIAVYSTVNLPFWIVLDMSYWRGRQPFGMVISWVAWFVIFGAAARLCLRIGRRIGRGWRMLLGTAGAVASTWLVVTIGTLAQFDATGAPRGEAATWFLRWLVPTGGKWDMGDVRGWEINNAGDTFHLLTSWPHVLLACGAFGMAYLLTADRSPARSS